MDQQQSISDILTAEQKEIIAVVRERLKSHHNVDTSSLDDLEMTARIAVIVDIMNSKKKVHGRLHDKEHDVDDYCDQHKKCGVFWIDHGADRIISNIFGYAVLYTAYAHPNASVYTHSVSNNP